MKEKEFVALVDRLEIYERDHPADYRLRVGLLAALGYLLLFGVLGLALVFVAVVIYARRINWLVIELLVVVLGVAFVILRSLWIEFPEPEGHELKYEDAPRLFDVVNEVRVATNGPRLHKVLLNEEYNASIVQRPRFGTFGWHQNYLLVGLPLLRALSPTDIRAVLGHEFGHLSGSHGKFSSWIYRVRQTWIQVLQNMQAHRRSGSGIFFRFFDWYAPYFEAYSFVLARAQEYEADRCAVAVSGKENTARALVNLRLKGKSLTEDFWPALYRRADTEPDPPRESFAEMLQSLRDPIPPDKAQVWFSQSLTTRHRYDDTHPALADRLAAIGYADVRQTASLESFVVADEDARADQYLLARLPAEFIEQQNNMWKEEMATRWSERHKYVAEADQKLAGFDEKAKSAELTVEERWERARFTAGKDGSVAAVGLVKEVLALEPDHAGANYTLGEALLEQGDEAGIKHIEVAMEKDVNSIPYGCEIISAFLIARDRAEEAEKYGECIAGYYDEVALGQQERETIAVTDEFESHGLSDEALEALRSQLEEFPLLAKAYLVKKVCKHFPESPGYVLGVVSKRVLYGLQIDRRDRKLISELAAGVNCTGYTFIIPLEHDYKPLLKIFKRFDGAEVYRAS